MKRLFFTFLTVAVLSVAMLPVTNYLVKRPALSGPLDKLSVLLDTDLLKPFVSWPLYLIGISTDPYKAVVGKHGWLFLGDAHGFTISEARHRTSAGDEEFTRRLNETSRAVSEFFSKRGVTNTLFLIGPNKDSIYPEMAPDWMRSPSVPNSTLELDRQIVDPRPAFISAKIQSSLLYFYSDTHWNARGAGLAFRLLFERLKAFDSSLQLLDDQLFRETRVAIVPGRDLSQFLRLSNHMDDQFPVMGYLLNQPKTMRADFETGVPVPDGQRPSLVRPLYVVNENAFNQRRVLWLQDSFAEMFWPLISRTFSNVVHWSWVDGLEDGPRLTALIEKFRPDVVIFTIVERSLRNPVCVSQATSRYCLHAPPDNERRQ